MSSDADKQQRGSDGGSGDGAPFARERQRLDGELGRFEPVSDGLVLAAVERAERHREREREGVMLSDIAEHLGFVHGSWTTRRLRPQLDALIAEGSLARWRRHGVVVWALTDAGRGHLERIRRAGEAGELPEAPQHRAWRHARVMAGERIDGFRADAREALEQTTVPSVHVYIADEDFAGPLTAAIAAAGLREVDEGGRVIFWRADPRILNLAKRHEGVPVVSAPRLYADLSSFDARGQDAADHVKSLLIDPLHPTVKDRQPIAEVAPA